MKWRVYFGEDPEAGESEDEDFCGGRAGGYTRDEITERDRKWKVVEDFENCIGGDGLIVRILADAIINVVLVVRARSCLFLGAITLEGRGILADLEIRAAPIAAQAIIAGGLAFFLSFHIAGSQARAPLLDIGLLAARSRLAMRELRECDGQNVHKHTRYRQRTKHGT